MDLTEFQVERGDLRAELARKCFKKQDFARQAGVHNSTLRRFLRGESLGLGSRLKIGVAARNAGLIPPHRVEAEGGKR